MPLQATSGAASYDAFGGGVAVVPNYIEDVFSTYLYAGNGSTQTITNGIDLAGKGGLVWIKDRTAGFSNGLYDTARGANKFLSSNTDSAESTQTQHLTAFNASGFSIGTSSIVNNGSANYVSWTFREQPKFFDVVTWTGSNDSGTSIGQGIVPHNLGSAPGCVIIKNVTQGATNWIVYHRSLSGGYRVLLNTTDAQTNSGSTAYFSKYDSGVGWVQTDPDANNIYVGYNYQTNGNGDTLVAYLFAHNAGGFGLSGTDNVISCGSFTTDGSGNATVTLGYEPQWLLVKSSSSGGQNWLVFDVMRGMYTGGSSFLNPNTSGAETAVTTGGIVAPTATGFTIGGASITTSSTTYIYIAIRRGPMKVPTDGTKVFSPNQTSATTGTPITTGFPVDWQLLGMNDGNVYNQRSSTRLTGVNTNGTSNSQYLVTSNTNAEAATGSVTLNWGSTGFQVPSLNSGSPTIFWNFGRAPGYFDEVCYTGTSGVMNVNHNLGVAPELMIFKNQSAARRWPVYTQPTGNTQALVLNVADAVNSTGNNYFNSTSPTSTVFTVNGSFADIGNSGNDYVAYLFATCPGVSKVGSYTGTGATLQIDCGFTAGARFVLIKKTSGTGSWYIWDSARGIVSGNDPYLLLNSTAAEVTSTDYIDTYSAGFEISSTAPSEINENGGSFIFLAIS